MSGSTGGNGTCLSGEIVTKSLSFKVVSTASARYDVGIYVPNKYGVDAGRYVRLMSAHSSYEQQAGSAYHQVV